MKKLLLYLLLCGFATGSWSQTYLTPNDIGGGTLPANVKNMVFTMFDGNWARFVNLPATSLNGSKIKLVTEASYTSSVILQNTDIPNYLMDLPRNRSIAFTYSAANKRWEMDAFTVKVPNSRQPLALPVTNNQVIRANVYNGAWSPQIILPESAENNAIVLITSKATWASSVAPTNMLFAQKMPLRWGEEYAFTYSAFLGKWLMARGPKAQLVWGRLSRAGKMPNPIKPWTLLDIPANVAGASIGLPNSASDRDRVIITSSAETPSTIRSDKVSEPATMKIVKGQTYEFMWNSKVMGWERVRAPQAILSLNSLTSGAMPELTTPVTEVVALEGADSINVLTLPTSGVNGDRVIVKSAAPAAVTVLGAVSSAMGSNTVNQGEEVSFVRKEAMWSRETYSISMLVVLGQTAANSIGLGALKARTTESMRRTNFALGESGANFRVQLAGHLQNPELSTNHGAALSLMRTDPVIQAEKIRVQADSIFFEGKFDNEQSCGFSYVNQTPNDYNMVSSGNTNCGTGLMAHEFGHAMGLNHNGGVLSTVMNNAGGATHFTTSRRFAPQSGIEMGHGAPIPDEALIMNMNASAVSKFR